MEGNDAESQEALARDFQPLLEGPLVGEKRSSHAITEEYAKADPIYVAKTTALPQRYSHYRPILGDGNCGWRATAYAYFETLLRQRSQSQLEEEMARMMSLNNLLTTAGGFDAWLLEDMVEETTILLGDLGGVVETSPEDVAVALLAERFNNADVSNSIVYHMRLLASSWLKANASTYEGFIPDVGGVEHYSQNTILPVNMEIDHLGMTLLIDVLLKPIGISVEIVYLDRTEGTQANTHLFQQEDANGAPTNPNAPRIHLLYRPSHYDILYKDHSSIQAVVEAQRRASNVQIHRATAFSQLQPIRSNHTDFAALDMSILSCIPGFSLPPPPQSMQNGFPTHYQSPIDQYTPASLATSVSPISPGASSSTTQSNSIPSAYPSQVSAQSSMPSSSHLPPHSTFPTGPTQLPSHTHLPSTHRLSVSSHPPVSPAQIPSNDVPPPVSLSASFRPSKYEWEAEWYDGPSFQTSTFKNSHYNVAHFNNPNFQPEEWTPECDELPCRKRSS